MIASARTSGRSTGGEMTGSTRRLGRRSMMESSTEEAWQMTKGPTIGAIYAMKAIQELGPLPSWTAGVRVILRNQ